MQVAKIWDLRNRELPVVFTRFSINRNTTRMTCHSVSVNRGADQQRALGRTSAHNLLKHEHAAARLVVILAEDMGDRRHT